MLTLKPTDEPRTFTVHTYDAGNDRYIFCDMTRQDIIDAAVKRGFFDVYRDIIWNGGRKIPDILRIVARTGPSEKEVTAISRAWVSWVEQHRGKVFEQFSPVVVA